MKITHIFKDGTTTEELKNVYVPKEIADEVARLAGRKEKKDEEDD